MTYKVFVRDATGLVRALTPLDNFMLGIVGITPGVALVLYNVYLPYLYPGVDMTWGTLGSIPVSLIFGATYCLLAFYIITTRSLFAWSFDRLVPSLIADVNDRFHAPMKSCSLLYWLRSCARYLCTQRM